MTQKATGYVVFIAAIGMMLGLMSVDVSKLATWHEATTPGFVASVIGHLGAVAAAFAGGKILPAPPEDRENKFTRSSDLKGG